MSVSASLMLYLVAGSAVAGAAYLNGEADSPWRRAAHLASAALFWPLHLPALLAPREHRAQTQRPGRLPADGLARGVAQVESELDAALSSLDGWAEGVLAPETDRFDELRGALAAQADRIRQIDQLLASPSAQPILPEAGGTEMPGGSRTQQCLHAREANLQRLRALRQRSHDDLMGTLAWIRELVSMIHLAKFSGAPASRAEELVSQIAAAVEGVSAIAVEDAPLQRLVEGDEADTVPAKPPANGAAVLADALDRPTTEQLQPDA